MKMMVLRRNLLLAWSQRSHPHPRPRQTKSNLQTENPRREKCKLRAKSCTHQTRSTETSNLDQKSHIWMRKRFDSKQNSRKESKRPKCTSHPNIRLEKRAYPFLESM